MRKGGGRNKGSAFERHVAGMIIAASKHLKITKQDCYRTPMSGGHVYAKNEHPSDLVMSEKLLKHFSSSIECKHYKWIDLQTLFTKKGQIFTWIDQASAASTKKRPPIVVMKWNNSRIFCIYPSDAFGLASSKVGYMRFFYKDRYWRVALFSDLLNSVFSKQKGSYK